MKADCATLTALPLHMLAIACCTPVASLPQTAERSLGSACVLTALSRHAGGVSARTLTAKAAKMERSNEFFMARICDLRLGIIGKRGGDRVDA